MKTLNVENMHCEKCVARISKAFEDEKIKVKIDLKNKTVLVDDKEVSKAIETLDDLGDRKSVV